MSTSAASPSHIHFSCSPIVSTSAVDPSCIHFSCCYLTVSTSAASANCICFSCCFLIASPRAAAHIVQSIHVVSTHVTGLVPTPQTTHFHNVCTPYSPGSHIQLSSPLSISHVINYTRPSHSSLCKAKKSGWWPGNEVHSTIHQPVLSFVGLKRIGSLISAQELTGHGSGGQYI